jgi:hypothetical protein
VKRRVHSDTRNLDWTIRLRWVPEQIRPIGPKQVYEGKVTPMWGTGLLVMPFSLIIFLILVIPVMLVVLPLRYMRVLPWTIEAIAYPWGKGKGPGTGRRWRVKGRRAELNRAIDEIAAALERGEDNPRIAGAART